MIKRYKYRSVNGERFAVKVSNSGLSINFWHITEHHTKLYTYIPRNEKYGKSACWHDPLCRELLADVNSETPSVEILRCAIDGMNVYPMNASERDWPIPNTPPLPEEH